MGPLGLMLYVLTDKEPAPGTHEEFIRPLWKQGVGSTVHCIAGDATGIIAAAAITATLGLPMWIDLIVEYVAGFAFGLFIFQALFMKNMMGGTYTKALRRSFVPEWLSMNMMMAGMAPTMVFLMMGRDMRAMEPTQPTFWFVMSIGVVVGFVIAYPVNVWMVGRSLKHGLMTVRPGTPAGDHHAPADHAAHEAPQVHDGGEDRPALPVDPAAARGRRDDHRPGSGGHAALLGQQGEPGAQREGRRWRCDAARDGDDTRHPGRGDA
jgi:hypothetical protein